MSGRGGEGGPFRLRTFQDEDLFPAIGVAVASEPASQRWSRGPHIHLAVHTPVFAPERSRGAGEPDRLSFVVALSILMKRREIAKAEPQIHIDHSIRVCP
jgi:hypothetical protein